MLVLACEHNLVRDVRIEMTPRNDRNAKRACGEGICICSNFSMSFSRTNASFVNTVIASTPAVRSVSLTFLFHA